MVGEVAVAFVGSWVVCPMESTGTMAWRCSEESSDANAMESTGSMGWCGILCSVERSDANTRSGDRSGPSVGVDVCAGGALAEGVETRAE